MQKRWANADAPSGGRAESSCRGLSGMDAARAAIGQGWPFAGGRRGRAPGTAMEGGKSREA
ncbi:hypothetical protein BZL42_09230 [Pseudomonas indica]|nr:hypothetical protein BZL42_09230 [Pseudomonas indica]